MGLIAELLEWARGTDGDAQVAEAKCDPGGGDIVTAVQYQNAGVDAQPRPGDYVLLVPGPESGSFVVAGYVDPANAGVAREGDVRLYCRDGSGAVVGELHLAHDGEPDWQATAGALIARADRTDAAIKVIHDALKKATATGLDPGDCGALYRTNIVAALGDQVSSAADKGYVT